MLVCPEIESKRKTSSDSRDVILSSDDDDRSSKDNYLKKYIVSPLLFALEVLRKPRHSSTKWLVYLQIVNCTLYWFVMEEQNMLYFYMSRRFDGFNGTDFALYTMTIKVNLVTYLCRRCDNFRICRVLTYFYPRSSASSAYCSLYRC